jgi:hypothetical protein
VRVPREWWIACNDCGPVDGPFATKRAAESYLNRKISSGYNHDRVPHSNNWHFLVVKGEAKRAEPEGKP